MIQADNITGLILAGGAGSRVGGQDKGLIQWRGKTLVAHVAGRLGQQTDRLLISCNRNIPEYRNLGFPTVADKRQGYQGPLAGIEAARDFIHTDYLAVVACDTPMLPHDLVARLAAPLGHGDDSGPLISFAHDGQRDQYLFALMDRRCLAGLSSYLEQGHRAVKHWYKQTPHVVVDFSDSVDSFLNYNHLESI